MKGVIAVVIVALMYGCASSAPKPSRWVDVAKSKRQDPNVCRGVMFAHTQAESERIDGAHGFEITSCLVEDYEVHVGERIRRRYIYIDPDTLEETGCRDAWVTCYDKTSVTGSGVCMDRLPDPDRDRRTGEPRLEVRNAPFAMPGSAGPYGAYMTFYVEILGELSEQWWCPAIRVRWPDDTETYRESDCDPFDGSQNGARDWSFRNAFAIGVHRVEFQILKGGKLLARKTVEFRIIGLEREDGIPEGLTR